ncbi:HECTdomain (Ubiquitin-transferase) domain containing protein [Balamuthia mandrillaris]
MGNFYSTAEILNEKIEDTAGRLYWPSLPFEGPVKLRFCCSKCNGEAILLQPFPEYWHELVVLKGECFACGGVRSIRTKFVEAGKHREAIWTFKGGDKRKLGEQLQKFVRSGPPAHAQLESLSEAGVYFERTIRPPNFRETVLPPDFLYPEGAAQLSLHERHQLFLRTFSKEVRGWDRLKIRIDRDQHILGQAFKQFQDVSPAKLRGSFKVKFNGEEAIDYGGVTQEFFQLVSEQMLDPHVNLFLPNGPNNTFHPSPSSSINELHLEYFRFFGRFLGKALIEDKLVKAPLTRAIWKLLLGKSLNFSDFHTVDKTAYLRLRQTLDFDEELLESCSLVFAANIDDFGEGKLYELKEGGENIPVTKDNLHEWIKLYSSWRMADSVTEQLENLLRGFYEVVPVQLIAPLFNEFELEQILCGLNELDVEDWKKHSVTVGFRSSEEKEQLAWFWEVLEQFANSQRGQVLQFTTGSAQVPVSFEYLHPPFTVALVKGLRTDSLPYGHTCFNRLDLPIYTSKEKMEESIQKALDFGLVGFGRK